MMALQPPTTLKRLSSQSGLRFQYSSPSDDFVDQTVFNRLLSTEEIVPIGVFFDLLDVLAGMVRQDLVDKLA